VLGYRNVGDPKSRRREIDPEQAKLVRRIFTLAAKGKGYLKIARTLNAERVKNPNGQDRRNTSKRTHQWSTSGIRAVLHNERYLGRVPYGRTRNVRPRGGKRTKAAGDRPVVANRPDLRIVSDALWRAPHDHGPGAHRRFPRPGAKGAMHLLSGLCTCGLCGGGLIVSRKSGKRGRVQTLLICTTRRSRGDESSTNRYGVEADDLADAVLAKVKHAFLNPYVLGRLLTAELERQKKAPDAVKAQREELTAKVARLAAETARLVDAVASGGGDVKALVTRLRGHESEHRDA
jgi:hypothetical protein